MTDEVEGHVRDKYELHRRLGKGAYGVVWKAIDRRSSEVVALKKIFDAFRNQTDAQRTFREIMFLQEFGRHPNIIKLFNILRADNDRDIYLVFEYMEADLHNSLIFSPPSRTTLKAFQVIKKMTILKDIHKQYIMCQLFRAIRYLHSGNVLHRDLKPSNVLLDADCRVKLADFGLARSLSQLDDYPEGQHLPELTEYVATRWYRSPEILLAAKRYTKGVDMWSLGCITAEMLLGRALFPGSSTINQIERIMNTIIKPSRTDIDSIGSHYAASVLEKMPQRPKKPLESLLPVNNTQAIDIINRLLLFAPHKRLNVEQCLVHPYVAQFHNPIEEPALSYDVTLPLPDHIQLTIHEYREQLYELIVSKRTNVCRIQHDKPLSKLAADPPPPPPPAPNTQQQQPLITIGGQASPQFATTPTRQQQPPLQQPSLQPGGGRHGNSPSGSTTTLKRRPETTATATTTPTALSGNLYSNNGVHDPHESAGVAVLRPRPRRGSSSSITAPPPPQPLNGYNTGGSGDIVKRSASQSNGFAASTSAAYYAAAAAATTTTAGGPLQKSASGHDAQRHAQAAYAQARRLSTGSQTYNEDAKRKNGYTNSAAAAVASSQHRQASTATKSHVYAGGGRRSSKCYPHIVDERTAPIAQAELSDTDFESSRSSYRQAATAARFASVKPVAAASSYYQQPHFVYKTRPIDARAETRAQSADTRLTRGYEGGGNVARTKKELRRSQDRLSGIFHAFRSRTATADATSKPVASAAAIAHRYGHVPG